jgi:hypothetical protein
VHRVREAARYSRRSAPGTAGSAPAGRLVLVDDSLRDAASRRHRDTVGAGPLPKLGEVESSRAVRAEAEAVWQAAQGDYEASALESAACGRCTGRPCRTEGPAVLVEARATTNWTGYAARPLQLLVLTGPP